MPDRISELIASGVHLLLCLMATWLLGCLSAFLFYVVFTSHFSVLATGVCILVAMLCTLGSGWFVRKGYLDIRHKLSETS